MTPLQVLVVAVAILCFSVTSNGDEGKDESGKGKLPKHERSKEKYDQDGNRYEPSRHGNYFAHYGYTRLDIPRGHYPPPGECRIWYPGEPAGQQPPPGSCRRLRAEVPLGAWLIQHPTDTPEVVHVHAYDERRRGHVQAVGEFNIGSGTFIRIILND